MVRSGSQLAKVYLDFGFDQEKEQLRGVEWSGDPWAFYFGPDVKSIFPRVPFVGSLFFSQMVVEVQVPVVLGTKTFGSGNKKKIYIWLLC